MRDVKRCIGLIKWFAEFWPGGAKAQKTISTLGRSLVLAITHVYCFRLASNSQRKSLWTKVSICVRDCGRQAEKCLMSAIADKTFPLAMVKRVQQSFADTFFVDSGIAMNEVCSQFNCKLLVFINNDYILFSFRL